MEEQKPRDIMVVDDDDEMQTLLQAVLRKDGYRVRGVDGGEAAIGRLGLDAAASKASLPDLIILDIMMAGIDGYTLNARLLADARTRNIPVLVLTARPHMRELFISCANIAVFMEKPFDPHVLRSRVAAVLAKRSN
ncbi:MAG: response regulator [Elusimicrobiota bacterium]|jgi:DNA-binding response OmpR family regulator